MIIVAKTVSGRVFYLEEFNADQQQFQFTLDIKKAWELDYINAEAILASFNTSKASQPIKSFEMKA